jgi:hypothetical protein
MRRAQIVGAAQRATTRLMCVTAFAVAGSANADGGFWSDQPRASSYGRFGIAMTIPGSCASEGGQKAGLHQYRRLEVGRGHSGSGGEEANQAAERGRESAPRRSGSGSIPSATLASRRSRRDRGGGEDAGEFNVPQDRVRGMEASRFADHASDLDDDAFRTVVE